MSAVIDPIVLRNIPLFRELKRPQLSRLSELLHRKVVAAGTTLISEDELIHKADKVAYIIQQGTVKVHIYDPVNDKNVTLAILGRGQIVGEMSLMDSRGRSASVTALEESTLFLIHHAVLQKCLRRMPLLTYHLVEVLASRLRLADAQIQAMATHKVPGRVARQILAFAEEYGQPTNDGHTLISLSLTANDLADLVGATSVSVYNALSDYKKNRYISIERKCYITVLNRDALSSAASC